MRKCHICKQKFLGLITSVIYRNMYVNTMSQSRKKKKMKRYVRFFFCDFESTHDTGEHQVNFCVAHRSCDKCMHLPVDAYCKTCTELPDKGREMIFEREDTLHKFCHWLFPAYSRGSICITHNFGGYDEQFILRHILEKWVFKPEVIINGYTIITMKAGKLRFIYSYRCLHMQLANYSDTSGLTEIKKGIFPILPTLQLSRTM